MRLYIEQQTAVNYSAKIYYYPDEKSKLQRLTEIFSEINWNYNNITIPIRKDTIKGLSSWVKNLKIKIDEKDRITLRFLWDKYFSTTLVEGKYE